MTFVRRHVVYSFIIVALCRDVWAWDGGERNVGPMIQVSDDVVVSHASSRDRHSLLLFDVRRAVTTAIELPLDTDLIRLLASSRDRAYLQVDRVHLYSFEWRSSRLKHLGQGRTLRAKGRPRLALRQIDAMLSAEDSSGEVLWATNIRGMLVEMTDQFAVVLEPAAIAAYSTSEGKLIWRRPASLRPSDVISNSDSVVIEPSECHYTGITDTGSDAWSWRSPQPSECAGALSDDLLVIASIGDATRAMIAIDLGTGREAWSYRSPVISARLPCATSAGVSFLEQDAGRYRLTAVGLARGSGVPRWKERLPAYSSEASMAPSGLGGLCVVAGPTRFVAYSAETGQVEYCDSALDRNRPCAGAFR
jgi:outer membrane protein assembly factor BamB